MDRTAAREEVAVSERLRRSVDVVAGTRKHDQTSPVSSSRTRNLQIAQQCSFGMTG